MIYSPKRHQRTKNDKEKIEKVLCVIGIELGTLGQTDDGILTDNPRDKIPPSQVADNSAEYWKRVIANIRNILETPDGSAVP